MVTQTLTVNLGKRSYPIYISHNLLNASDLLFPHIIGQQVMIVTNETVAPLYLDPIKKIFKSYQCDTVLIPDGEQYKTLIILNTVFDELLKKNHHRNTTLITLGGGVVSDLAGFAAACYQRGVNYLQIPTTLLAQVDASVGGKTAVNHALGKNMIGAFHQPQCVLIDIATLDTLNDREFKAGLGEVIKYSLMIDVDFYHWLDLNIEKLIHKEPEVLMHAISRSCAIKASIVSTDETETKNMRVLLNLGHTFAHVIETMTNYVEYLHGEAVAIGLLLAAKLSQQLGNITVEDVKKLESILLRANLPTYPPKKLTFRNFMSLVQRDKKMQSDKTTLVLLESIGKAVIVNDVKEELLRSIFE